MGRRRRLAASAAIATAFGMTACGTAFAQAPAPDAPIQTAAVPPTAHNPSDSLAVNLMRLLVKQGVISQGAADQLVAEAERETAEARAAGAGQGAVAANLPPPAPGATRIPYVPDIVKNQIREELRQDVIRQAREENWAQPNAIPAWTKRLEISGDVRLRYESNLYSSQNAPDIINYAALNATGPIDVNPDTNPTGVPILNTRQNRNGQFALRARLDILANPSDWLTADIRIASGSSNTPVSTNQALGGGLTKKEFWLDRAYVDLHPASWIGGRFGRMPNPFQSTELVYDSDLNFDGITARTARNILPDHGVSLFGVAGAFLIDYRDANFPTNNFSDQKADTRSKWMFGVQAGVDWKANRFSWKTGLAYYSYQNNDGSLSAPCALYTGVVQCSTDFSRPSFMQKGNTLFQIRNIVPDPRLQSPPAPQFVGLMFSYHVVNLTSTFDLPLSNGKHLILTGDYARNLAYKHGRACRYGVLGLPVTNVIAPSITDTDPCAPGALAKFHSGPNAFLLQATYGDAEPYRFGQWNVSGGYRHIAPDAVIDAYTDSDFHLGGTNAKGYFLSAAVGLMDGANLQFRWFSADEVFGSPLSIDVGQIDLNARF